MPTWFPKRWQAAPSKSMQRFSQQVSKHVERARNAFDGSKPRNVNQSRLRDRFLNA